MTDLVTVPGVTLTHTAATPTGTLDAATLVDACRQLRTVDDELRWQLGDLAVALVHEVGSPAAMRALAPLGHDQATLTAVIAVAVAVPPSNRRGGLSWAHHREVRRMDPSAQAVWLGRAETEDWSPRDLRRAITADHSGGDQ